MPDDSTGQYFHRSFTTCLSERIGDQLGIGHSPIYGWLNDGLPIYGPFYDSSILGLKLFIYFSLSYFYL